MGNGRRFGGISSSIGGIYKLGSLEGGERVMGNGGKPIIINEYTACVFNEQKLKPDGPLDTFHLCRLPCRAYV